MAKPYVTHTGPIYSRTVGATIRKAIKKAVRSVATVGRNEVKASLTEGYGLKSGEFKKGVKFGNVKGSYGFVSRVYARDGRKGAWLAGTSKLNARSKFKGLKPPPFTKATTATQAAAEAKTTEIIQALVETLGGA